MDSKHKNIPVTGHKTRPFNSHLDTIIQVVESRPTLYEFSKMFTIVNSHSVVVWFTCYSVPLDNQWLVSYSGGTLMT